MMEPTDSTGNRGRFTKWLTLLCVIFCAAGVGYWLGIQTEEKPLPDPGVVVFRHNQRSESTEERARGFLETMQNEYPHINILSSVQYLGSTRESSVRQTRLIVDKFGDSITGVFSVNEANAVGCLLTLADTGRAGAIPFIGVDASAVMLASLREGKVSGIILQDPVQIGYQAVNSAILHLQGQPIEEVITTSHRVVTSENLDAKDMRQYLYPERFSEAEFQSADSEYTIGVVTKGLTLEFWQSVRAGAEKAARDAENTLIRFQAPVLEHDVKGQIEIVRKMIEEKMSAICLAPIDSTQLVDVVIEAHRAGVPIVIFDSGLDTTGKPKAAEAIVSYVATDNYEVGAAAARLLAEDLNSSPSTK